jgi:hypothetical protein
MLYNGSMAKRGLVGERNNKAKLTTSDVLAIRDSRESGPILASHYGVTEGTICDIRCRRSWDHVPPQARMDEPGEEWRPVISYEDRYEVSNMGRLRALFSRTGMILKAKPDRTGYYHVVLIRDKHRITPTIHRIVMAAFVGPCPSGHQVNHISGRKSDNRLENLEYVTPKANKAHAIRLGLVAVGERSGRAKITSDMVRQIRNLDMTQVQCAQKFGITQTQVSRIRRRQSWRHVL